MVQERLSVIGLNDYREFLWIILKYKMPKMTYIDLKVNCTFDYLCKPYKKTET